MPQDPSKSLVLRSLKDAQRHTTITRLTSSVPSAIAVLEIVGPDAISAVEKIWSPNQGDSALEINRIRYGTTRGSGPIAGESVVVCRTAEDRVEIHCHGGRYASEAIVKSVSLLGFLEQVIAPKLSTGELIESEAREDLVRATTLRTTAILLDQLRGALSEEWRAIRELFDAADWTAALVRIQGLLERSIAGRHVVEPWRVVLAGPPNAGKSSLLNRLLGYTRAIVHEQAGTTRDLLLERSSFEGWPIELIDSAGIRSAIEEVESVGIANTLERIAIADCTLLLVDAADGWTETHDAILSYCTGAVLVVKTKIDLDARGFLAGTKFSTGIFSGKIVETSAVTGTGIHELMHSVVASLVPKPILQGDAVPFRKRHCDLIEFAVAALKSENYDVLQGLRI